jgi:hypothetical protein
MIIIKGEGVIYQQQSMLSRRAWYDWYNVVSPHEKITNRKKNDVLK